MDEKRTGRRTQRDEEQTKSAGKGKEKWTTRRNQDENYRKVDESENAQTATAIPTESAVSLKQL